MVLNCCPTLFANMREVLRAASWNTVWPWHSCFADWLCCCPCAARPHGPWLSSAAAPASLEDRRPSRRQGRGTYCKYRCSVVDVGWVRTTRSNLRKTTTSAKHFGAGGTVNCYSNINDFRRSQMRIACKRLGLEIHYSDFWMERNQICTECMHPGFETTYYSRPEKGLSPCHNAATVRCREWLDPASFSHDLMCSQIPAAMSKRP